MLVGWTNNVPLPSLHASPTDDKSDMKQHGQVIKQLSSPPNRLREQRGDRHKEFHNSLRAKEKEKDQGKEYDKETKRRRP